MNSSARAAVVACVGAVLGLGVCACTEAALPLEQIDLPAGFHISVYADHIEQAREMTLGEEGTVYVGTTSDKVYGIAPVNNGDKPRVYVVAKGLHTPNGVAYKDGKLYVAELSRISRVDTPRQANSKLTTVYDKLPGETHHGPKVIHFGPEGWLYVAVGSPCNVCIPDSRHGVIERLDVSAKQPQLQLVAKGVRNSVGFDWHPDTHVLWFTDNGRDMLGNDVPADELNRLGDGNNDFGFPYCHQGDVADPEFGAQHNCSEFVAPAQKLGAHVAALGMRFYTGTQFPKEYRKQIFIAEHGSWNRTPKSGYRVSLVKLNGDQAVSYLPFASGWLQREQPWGRPVDILVLPDGSLLVSDDFANVIYRIEYREK